MRTVQDMSEPIDPAVRGRLPTMLVIGAMKCGTTALHRYLDAHPDIDMAHKKEVNFFVGPERAPDADPSTWWRIGHWHQGLDWYASQLDPTAPVRGESSPAYTSPGQGPAAERIAQVLPGVRLVYLVRDPVERAVSQYLHHRRDREELRDLTEAVLDPHSEYLGRSRYHQQVAPYLERFAAEQLLVVVQERLLANRHEELARVYAHVGADPDWWDDELDRRWHVRGEEVAVPADLRVAVAEQVLPDVRRLRALIGDDLPEWDLPA